MNNKDFEKLCYEANNKKLRLTKKLQKEIRRIYSKIYLKGSVSDLKCVDDKLIKKRIEAILKSLSMDILAMQEEIEALLIEYLNEIAIVANKPQAQMIFNLDKAYKLGLVVFVNKLFNKAPAKAVSKVLTGTLYIDRLSFKRRLRRALKKNTKDLKYIVDTGLKQDKTLDQVFKDLRIYLQVGKNKPLSWINSYPKASTQIDYNVQRISKTYASHVFQEAQKESCKRNPFIIGVKWLTSNSHRVCPICKARDGVIYKLDNVPIDHPNGMCTTIPVLEKELDQIGEELGKWVRGGNNSKLDRWFKKYENL